MPEATVTSKGQITIPIQVRKALGLEAGDRLVFELRDDGLRVRALHRRKASDLRGAVRSDARYVSREAERAAAAEGRARTKAPRRGRRPMKVWVDATVILRLLTGEPEKMASSAQTLFQGAEQGELALHLSTLVAAEVVWALGSYYRIPRPRIAEVVMQVAMAEGVECEKRGLLVDALASMAEKNVDFVDAYLARLASSDDGAVASFDRDFARLPARQLHPDDVGT